MFNFKKNNNLFNFTSYFKEKPLRTFNKTELRIYTTCSILRTDEEKNACVKGFNAGMEYSAEEIAGQEKLILPH